MYIKIFKLIGIYNRYIIMDIKVFMHNLVFNTNESYYFNCIFTLTYKLLTFKILQLTFNIFEIVE